MTSAGRVVISQSMYFPWVGLLEQVRLADVFVHYDDVQYARGFLNRVQIKTPVGTKWLTVPLRDWHRGQRIDEVQVDEREDWRSQHRELLRQNYLKAPHLADMLALVDGVFSQPTACLADVTRASILALSGYFGLENGTRFLRSDDLGVSGSSSQRLHDLVRSVGGNVYITGHGARNYLDHEIFEQSGIEVRYMQYRCYPYLQLYGEFTPYVTALDLIANCGATGKQYIQSDSINWKEFIHESH